MRGGGDFQLDYAGVGELLRSPLMQAAVTTTARVVAGHVGRPRVERGRKVAEVVVTESQTDRAAAYVTVRHPAALALQAKNGLLTRAASAAGLEVRGRGGRS